MALPHTLRRRAAGILLAWTFFCAFPEGLRAQVALKDAQQKAVFVRNILSFVEWPAESAVDREKPFQLCVEGDALLAFALSQELRGLTLHERKAAVRVTASEKDWKGCQIVLFGNLAEKKVPRLLAIASDAKVLTIGQTQGFLEAGGAIQLAPENGGFRFEVNLEAARNAGVKLDSRLLRLAKRVLNGGELAGG